jgi:TetR/AcrR family transcriptional regulator, cholesterol catabolism regulator
LKGLVLGVRQLRKQATRDRVLAVARDLFDEVGYETATLRMVAQRAGVSVGSIFTTFASKAELLYQVMAERLGDIYAELESVAPHLRGPTVDRLRSVMAVHYGFETRRLNLFVAYIAGSYSGTPGTATMPTLGSNERFNALLRDILAAGVERGDVRADADIDTFTDALVGCYFWNYRLTLSDSLTPAELIDRMDRQIGLLFEGVART